MALSELQEKAKLLISEHPNGVDPAFVQLIDDLCREGELIIEESKKEQEDLKQQVRSVFINICSNLYLFVKY